MPLATMNQLDKGSNQTLSGENLTATDTAGYQDSVRATVGLTVGKWYWEVKIESTGSKYNCPGLANGLHIMHSAAGQNYYPGNDTNGYGQYCVDTTHGWMSEGSSSGTVPDPGELLAGDIVMFALNLNNGKMQIGKNGTWICGDPATDSTPQTSNIQLGFTWYPTLCSKNGAMTANFGQTDFSYTIPTGFSEVSGLYIYRSTDTSAPQLTGQAGKFIAILDACLVNGYGTKAPIGWTKSYTGTNLASYKMPTGTSQSYLGVSNLTNIVRSRGFSAMTAAGPAAASGTNPQPTDVQVSGGLYFQTSTTTDAVVRAWTLISNGKLFYFFTDLASGGYLNLFVFGDISSYNESDSNACFMLAHGSDNKCRAGEVHTTSSVSTGYSHLLAQKYDNITWSQTCGKCPMRGFHGLFNAGVVTNVAYPDPIQGGVLLTPQYIHEGGGAGTGVLRGWLPGFQAPCANSPFSLGDVIVGTEDTDLEGRYFECFSVRNDTVICDILIEMSDTQDTYWR